MQAFNEAFGMSQIRFSCAQLRVGSWGSRIKTLFSRKAKVSVFLENLETVSCSLVGDLRVIFVTNDSKRNPETSRTLSFVSKSYK